MKHGQNTDKRLLLWRTETSLTLRVSVSRETEASLTLRVSVRVQGGIRCGITLTRSVSEAPDLGVAVIGLNQSAGSVRLEGGIRPSLEAAAAGFALPSSAARHTAACILLIPTPQ